MAAAAYRAGERLHDERTGLTHDYSRRRSNIPEVFVMAPANAPGWVRDRGKLWNAVEAAERRKDAQLAREVNMALPRELKLEEQSELLREYVQDAFVNFGMVAGIAIHVHDAKNPHAHLMLTTRDIGPEGFGKKNRSWNDREMLETQRERWAEACNRRLSLAGHEVRVDHRTLEAQGVERLPTVHLGPNVIRMERRGISTDRGEIGRRVEKQNGELRGISAEIIDMASARKRVEAERMEAEKKEAARKAEERLREAEREILESVRAVNAKLRALSGGIGKGTGAEKPEAAATVEEQAARGDFVRNPLAPKGKEALQKEPEASSILERAGDGPEREKRELEQQVQKGVAEVSEQAALQEGPGAPSKEAPARDGSAGRLYLKVPYEEKDTAKASGAKFDRDKKQWYVPPGVDTAAFAKWTPGAVSKGAPERRRRLENPYTQPRKDAEDAMHRAHFAWEEAAQPYCDKIKADVQRRDKLFHAARDVKEKLKTHEQSGFFARLIRRGEKNDLQERLMRIEEELGAIPETLGIYSDYCTLYNDQVRAIIAPIMAREHPGLAERWTGAIQHRDEIKKQEEDWSVERRHELDEAVSRVSVLLSKDPRFNPRGAFEDQERFEIAKGLIRERIDKGERFEGPEDPKLEKVKEKANKMQLEQELGWSR